MKASQPYLLQKMYSLRNYKRFFTNLSLPFIITVFALLAGFSLIHPLTIQAANIGDQQCEHPNDPAVGNNGIQTWHCSGGRGGAVCGWVTYDHCSNWAICTNASSTKVQCVTKQNMQCTCSQADLKGPNFRCGQYNGSCQGNAVCKAGTTDPSTQGIVCSQPNGQATKCDHNNDQTAGNNGFHDSQGQQKYCGLDSYCSDSKGGNNPCLPLQRQCENPVTPQPDYPGPGIQGSGKNLFKVIRKDASGKVIGETSGQDLANSGVKECGKGDVCVNGACQKGTCTCEHPGDASGGNNGISCGGFTASDQPNYCGAGDACTQQKGQAPVCTKGNCNCTSSTPDDTGQYQNGITCGSFGPRDQPPNSKPGENSPDGNFCAPNHYCHQAKAGDNNPTCLPLNCSCKSPGKEGSGNNTFLCGSDAREVAVCGLNEVCQDTTPVANPNPNVGGPTIEIPTCVKLSCTCAQPGASKSRNCGTSSVNYDCPDGQVCNGSGTNTTCSAAQPTSPPPTLGPPPQPPCAQFASDGTGKCLSVVTALSLATPGSNGTSTDPVAFIEQIFQVLLGVGGGIALLLIMFAGYRLMVSQGKPEAIQQAREQLIAAIVGILFFIFSIVILEAIGVDLLHIPGLGK